MTVGRCQKCGQTFDNLAAHRRTGCDWTRREFANGSVELRNDRTATLFIEAPNPFGGSWSTTRQPRVYGAGGNPSTEGIFRRGRKWALRMEPDEGWSWVPCSD